MEYLEEMYPQNPLLPKEPLLRAKVSGAWTAAFKALAIYIYDSVFVELSERTYHHHTPYGHLNKINKITTYRARLNKMQKFEVNFSNTIKVFLNSAVAKISHPKLIEMFNGTQISQDIV